MLDAGDFFNIFGSIKRFRWLREIFHQTLVAVWVVYLSYLPLWSSAVPPLPLAPVPPLSLYSVLVFFFPLSLGSQPKLTFCSSLYWSCPVSLLCIVFCRVLRDSTPRFVGPSVGPSVRPSVTLYFFGVNGFFGLTAPAQMLHWPQLWPLSTRTRLGYPRIRPSLI